MEIYTLSSRFLPKERINQFTSAIWTERYFTAGDVQLVVQATREFSEMLKPGTFLWTRGSKEVMMVESHAIKDGLLTVTGSSVLKFLNERQAWFANPEYDGSDTNVPMAAPSSDTTYAGQIISNVVYHSAIAGSGSVFSSTYTPINLQWADDRFPGLELGPVDNNGPVERFSIPLGPLYDGIQKLAQEEGLGLKLYLQSASYDSGFVFRFATYRGKDRTSTQYVHPIVRLTPKMDALTDVQEIRSIAQYKNVFYVLYKNAITVHYVDGIGVPSSPFDRRTMLVEAPDAYFLPGLDYDAKVAAHRNTAAKNAIANHLYVQAIDGNVSSKIPYDYGIDYGLGDIIELQGYTSLYSKARVTEYIRSQDQYGEQEYPTLSVLDPDYFGFFPDTEPDTDFPEWYDDPDFDLDSDDDLWADDEHIEDDDEDLPNEDEDPNPDPTPDFDGPPHADFTWEIT